MTNGLFDHPVLLNSNMLELANFEKLEKIDYVDILDQQVRPRKCYQISNKTNGSKNILIVSSIEINSLNKKQINYFNSLNKI